MDNITGPDQEQVTLWSESKNLVDRLIVVVGAGQSGMAAARLGCKLQARVRVLEEDPASLTQDKCNSLTVMGAEFFSGQHLSEQFDGADMIVLSPGVTKRSLSQLMPENIPVVSELEMASWFVTEPIIAVTGTNGKTTTASLVDHLLRHCGFDTFLGGNIGTPLSDFVLSDRKVDLLVLEVSSFQLQHTFTFRPNVSVFLNFAPNHLDYHRDLQDYLQAKLKIFQNQQEEDWAILPEQLLSTIDTKAMRSRVIIVDQPRSFQCPALKGPHNGLNIETALTACQYFGLEEAKILPALESYQARPHRLQTVMDMKGLLFVDDSKATTLDALKAALKSFERPICLLAGGRYKGGDPGELADLLQQKVRVVVLFGENRQMFTEAWQDYVSVFWLPTLEQATYSIYSQAKSGDVILLSPGTSSFDLFKNYKERGLAFQRVVESLTHT